MASMLSPNTEEQLLYEALLSATDVNAVILDFERAHRKEQSQRRSRRVTPTVSPMQASIPMGSTPYDEGEMLGMFSPLLPLETYLAGKSGSLVRGSSLPRAAHPSFQHRSPPRPVLRIPSPEVVPSPPSRKVNAPRRKRDDSPSRSSSTSSGSSEDSRAVRRRERAAKEAMPPRRKSVSGVTAVAPSRGGPKKVVKKVVAVSKNSVPASKPSTPKVAASKPQVSKSPQPVKPVIARKAAAKVSPEVQDEAVDRAVDNALFRPQTTVSPGAVFRGQPSVAHSIAVEPAHFRRLLLSAGMTVPSGNGGYATSPDGSLAPADFRQMDVSGPPIRRGHNISGASVAQMSEPPAPRPSEQTGYSLSPQSKPLAPRPSEGADYSLSPQGSVPVFPTAPNITSYFSTGHGSTITPIMTHWTQPTLFANRVVVVPAPYQAVVSVPPPQAYYAVVPPSPEYNQVIEPYYHHQPPSAPRYVSQSPQRRPILSPSVDDSMVPAHHSPPPPVLKERDSATAVSPGRYSRGHRLQSPQMPGNPKEPTRRTFC